MGLGTLPRWGRSRAGLVLALLAWSCSSGDGMGPVSSQATLTLAPAFSGPARVGIADADSVRVRVARTDGGMVYDTTVAVTSSSVNLPLGIDYTPPSELFTLEVEVLNSVARVVFRGGPLDFTIGDESGDIVLPIEMRYVGTGYDAASIRIAQSLLEAEVGDVVVFEAEAVDEDDMPIPGTPIVWSIESGSVGSVEIDGAVARLTAEQPGLARVTARLLTPVENPHAYTAMVMVEAANQSPIAVAGPDVTITDDDRSGSESVTLDGTGSTDPDGTIVSYRWTEGEATLATSGSLTRAFQVGAHTLTLTVTDDLGATASDDVVVTVNSPDNEAPTAVAGPDRLLVDSDGSGAESVTLDGSGSTDADGSIASYRWTEGSTTLGTGERLTRVFGVGRHTVTLTVTDDGSPAISSTDVVIVEVTANRPPNAVAGSDRTATDTDNSGAEIVTLDGSASSDPDGTIASYLWTEGGATLETGASISPSFSVGTHTVTLTVTDNGGATDSDVVIVRVDPGNQPPTAVAGPDQTVTDTDGSGSEPVTLDGSDSFDPDGSIASYVWNWDGDIYSNEVTFTAAFGVGRHEVTLRVTDDMGATDTDVVVVTVEEAQSARLSVSIESDVANTRVLGDVTPGIDCYSGPAGNELGTCSGEYAAGTTVLLSASVDAGVEAGFVRWTDKGGDPLPGCGGIDPCAIEITGDQHVEAHFIAGEVWPFLSVQPSILEPVDQATTLVRVFTRVFDSEGSDLPGAKVVFSVSEGCFEWSDPRASAPEEMVVTSGTNGRVEATGHACVRSPEDANDPRFRVRLAGSASQSGRYRLAVDDDLPESASIVAVSDTVQWILCGQFPHSFEVRVSAGGQILRDAPVRWRFGNVFAHRTDSRGESSEGYGEPLNCSGFREVSVTASIETEVGPKAVTFTVFAEPDALTLGPRRSSPLGGGGEPTGAGSAILARPRGQRSPLQASGAQVREGFEDSVFVAVLQPLADGSIRGSGEIPDCVAGRRSHLEERNPGSVVDCGVGLE